MGKTNSIEEEIELRKVTRKKITEVERSETEIKETKELNIEQESKKIKLLEDLYFEKGYIIDEIIVTEIKLEKLKIPETTINAIKTSIVFNRRLKN